MMPRNKRQGALALCAGLPLLLAPVSIHSEATANQPTGQHQTKSHSSTQAVGAVKEKRPPNT